MQSKQKKVKWSRGETASALEERTDTGITEVSVAKMQNIISDIYGNISRRPALKIIDYDPSGADLPVFSLSGKVVSTYIEPEAAHACVFTIDANSYIIFIRADIYFEGFLIQNNKFIRKVEISDLTLGLDFADLYTEIKTAQYNNYMIVYGLYKKPVIFKLTSDNNIDVDPYIYSAPWIAPNGTKSKVVDGSDLSGIQINKDGNGFNTYTYSDRYTQTATIYSWIDTGLTGNMESVKRTISTGSIVQMPQIGTYMRVEGYDYYQGNFAFPDTVFDGVVGVGGTRPSTGTYAVLTASGDGFSVSKFVNGHYQGSTNYSTRQFIVRNTASSTGFSQQLSSGWQNISNPKIMMYGALLTPVADNTAKDTSLTVEYGYISLKDYYPTAFTFSQQRLYASRWDSLDDTTFPKLIPGFAAGSQIGRYNDFKNDYNQENEPLEIDISTAYQEQILYMTDYNGLKIFTDSAEYAYNQDSGAVKQSENGSKPDCQPIVFGSTLIYADKSNKQIRVMQYEFGANLFNSSTINQFTQEDLVFNTITMVGFQDKEHCTGHFLYAIQSTNSQKFYSYATAKPTHSIAVCNLTPQNQAMIWSRWDTPKIVKDTLITSNKYVNILQNAIEINNKIWFIVELYAPTHGLANLVGYTLAELDYDATMDFETEVTPDTTKAIIVPGENGGSNDLYAWTTTDQQTAYETIYTTKQTISTTDEIYTKTRQRLPATILSTPTGPNTNIGGIDLYAWRIQYLGPSSPIAMYSDVPIPGVGDTIYYLDGTPNYTITECEYDEETGTLVIHRPDQTTLLTTFERVPPPFSIRLLGLTLEYTRDGTKDLYKSLGYVGNTTISVFDGDKYMWDDTVDEHGTLTKPLTDLEHPKIGFKIDAELVSHPMDIGGKTYTTTKRIAKAKMVVRDTEPGAVQINDKYGYMDLDKKIINFYNVTGMKKEVKYVIKNNNGAKFTIESIMFDMEYGTLD